MNLKLIKPPIAVLYLLLIGLSAHAQYSAYPLQPVPFTEVKFTDQFWYPKLETINRITIPFAFSQTKERMLNFKEAAELTEESVIAFNGSWQVGNDGKVNSLYPFDDSDMFKIIEAASYSLQQFPNNELEEYLDSIITVVGKAQEEDGYLYTFRTIANKYNSPLHEWLGNNRWQHVEELSHELYNLGHLFEAAVGHHEATGKTNLLNIAVKAADLLYDTFGWGKLEKYPGHQEVEKGLIRLSLCVNDARYLELAKFFLDARGGGPEYCQAHKPVTQQTKAVGHSVRATYMYIAMADIAALTGQYDYQHAIDEIWKDIVEKKIYITGGIGASGGNEGFNEPYHLPNSSAYCETCASIGNIYFNHRMFLRHKESKYIDVLEQSLYNGMLSGISLSGDRFFYPNPLETNGADRHKWFGCSCCPTNIARMIPSIPGYMYAHNKDTLYVNLFAQSEASLQFGNTNVNIVQKSAYPWDGDIKLILNPEVSSEFTLMIRIPGWARNQVFEGDLYSFHEKYDTQTHINGESVGNKLIDGYFPITRNWSEGDEVNIHFEMPVRKIISKEQVVGNHERFTIQRGPIVYCAEGVDNEITNVLTQKYELDAHTEASFSEELLGGVEVIEIEPRDYENIDNSIKLIPYFARSNRQTCPMQVWLSYQQPREMPDSLIIVDESKGDYATSNHVSPWESLAAIYDIYGAAPVSSSDKGSSAFGNWNWGESVGKWNWVQYNFHKVYRISTSQVYWWDDNAGITLPDSTFLSYWDENESLFVPIDKTFSTQEQGTIKWDIFNTISFEPVTTNKIRLNFYGNQKAQGILEWHVYTPSLISSLANDMVQTSSLFNVIRQGNIIQLRVLNEKETFVQIYNLSGHLLFQNNIHQELNYHLSERLPNGVLLIRASQGYQVDVKKVVF
ncbi:hypothetical protein SAMN05444274_11334 [Mariniphaga anaerophila]|uniref:Uncharacterized protein n=1 Tax=Mariniphaga anaerophila TaxID=1484053 RepID=A0A1M5FLB3_9BACT|nr:beta-L-arabinofuranosidase domain-containing protein [Mariniphaga anaerophila]SHF92387.1 hypothetical protein SAMN05444274_11334 [Mariniphaga anaerophila]